MSDSVKQETDKRFGIAVTAIQDMLRAVQMERGVTDARINELESLLSIQKKAEGDKDAKKKPSL